jgi:hypothetical protein
MKLLCSVLIIVFTFTFTLALRLNNHTLHPSHEVTNVLDDKDATYKNNGKYYNNIEVSELIYDQTADSLDENEKQALEPTKCASTTCYSCVLEDGYEWIIDENNKGTCTKVVESTKEWYSKAMMCPEEDYNFELCPHYTDSITDGYSRIIRLSFPQSVQYMFCYWVINNADEEDVGVKVTKGDVSLLSD